METLNMTLGIIGGLKGWEIVVILFVVLLMFGGRKIPELMRGLGKGIREFKGGMSGLEEEIKKEDNKPAKKDNKEAEA